MANGFSSGMPYWVKSDGTNALWFLNVKGYWMIGPKSKLGENEGYLHSTNSPLCPESVGSHWKYRDNGEWLDAQGNAKMFKYEGMTYQGNKQFINGK